MKPINQKPIYNYVYSARDTTPVLIKSVDMISEIEHRKLVKQYNTAGFVVFELLDNKVNQDALLKLATSLKLGNPFIPNIYSSKKNIYKRNGLNEIKISNGTHRAFQSGNEQEIHSDGTLEPIGKIKSSVLLCITPAVEGGETIIFNSVAAFYDLLKNERLASIASSLLDPRALKRIAVNGGGEMNIGPAFSIKEGEILSRFSLDNTCYWEYGFKEVQFLREAYYLMVEMVKNSSPYYIEFKLKGNQGVLMANHKISHGRREYTDGNKKRTMIRGLFHKEI
ncbi:TauD/TfdA family dioxygenase [Virgibacillus sediminis]|uniref:TauD/TfdA family dioxygenase n=1 Tax=Virgibacillus sediminis TaxID=202260 RepID=A0ABV7A5C4_9BACI